MANPYHHAVSSVKKWGGVPDDYIEIHRWFDESKAHFGDFRHRALRHHTEGIFLMESIFGPTLELSTCTKCGEHADTGDHRLYPPGTGVGGRLPDPDRHAFVPKVVPTRWVGEQHVVEDLGRLVTVQDWLSCMTPQPWMNRSRKLSVELEQEATVTALDDRRRVGDVPSENIEEALRGRIADGPPA